MNDETSETNETKTPVTPAPAFRLVGDLAPLFAAKAAARLEFKPIIKNRHVTVQTDKGPYEFDYATLDSVRDAVDAALAKNGLDLWHIWCDSVPGWYELHTFLSHASGAYVQSILSFRAIGEFSRRDGGSYERPLKHQEIGSLLTYWERYADVAMLGVASEADDDGNAADGNQVVEARDRSKAPTPPKQAAKPKEAPKPKTNGESELRTQPTSDRPPPPERQVVNDNPCSKETSSEIAKHLRALSIKGIEATNMCMSVTGKAPAELNESDGQKMLGHVQKLAEAEGVVVQ